RARCGDPFFAHAITNRAGQHFARERPVSQAIANVNAAVLRTAHERTRRDLPQTLIEAIVEAVAEERQSIADMPAEALINEANAGVEVVAGGVGEEHGVHVEYDPVDDALLAGDAALRLPAVVDAEAELHEIVCDFGRSRNVSLQVTAEGIEAL